MPRHAQIAHAYKDVTLSQLRSFVETARSGSLSAAAEELGLTHPTIWMQVHALERVLGAKLLEPVGRGMKLTAAGEVLLTLATSLVRDAGTLKRRFADAVSKLRPALRIVTTPRVLAEDLPPVLKQFSVRHPGIDLTVTELGFEEALSRLQAGQADAAMLVDTPQLSSALVNPWLEFRPLYHATCYLICQKSHRFAKQRTVTLEDLVGEPLVNGPSSFPDAATTEKLAKLGVFHSRSLRVEAQFTATSRAYVKHGFGIALVSRHPSQPADPDLHERDLTKHIGRLTIGLVTRKSEPPRSATVAFEEVVREVLAEVAKKPRKPVR